MEPKRGRKIEKNLVIAVAASIEKNPLFLVVLRVQNVVAEYDSKMNKEGNIPQKE